MLVKVNGFKGTSNVLILPRQEVIFGTGVIMPYTRAHTELHKLCVITM